MPATDKFAQDIGIILPLASFFLLTVLAIAKIFFYIRRRFPIRVNCWFCNRNDRIAYDLRNSFICKGCNQYNGFTTDGDYNREIPEQHFTKLNPVTNCVFSEENVYDLKKTNGLCYSCNRNQELKILQLASFVPENDDNFDLEVDQYKDSLEKAYKLCTRCERVVKRSINKVKSRFVGKQNPQEAPRKLKLVGGLLWASVGLAAVNFTAVLVNLRISQKSMELWIGEGASEALLKTFAYILALKTVFMNYVVENPISSAIFLYWKAPVDYLSSFLTFEQTDRDTYHDFKELFNISATLVTILLIVISEGRRLGVFSTLLLLWSFITLLHNHKIFIGPVDHEIVSISEFLTAILAFGLSYRCLVTPMTFKKQNLNSSFHKIYPETAQDSEEEEEELSISRNSTNNSVLNASLNSTIRPSQFPSATIYSSSPVSMLSKNTSKIDLTVPHLFQSSLNLNTLNNSHVRHRGSTNPFLTHLNLDRQTPRSIISPPRLIPNTVSEPSWVAGGFWPTSPSKSNQSPIPNTDFVPIMSRTSSQSSGFESSAPFSRENSVAKDDRASVFSEPLLKPTAVYPSMKRFTTPRPTSNLGDSFFSRPGNGLYKSTSPPHDKWGRPSVLGQRGSIFNFKKFGNDLPQL